MKKIIATLTAYNMGPNATEADFDAWTAYVNEHIDEALGFTVEIDQFRFANSGESVDVITGATDEQRDAIREYLSHSGWEAFCSQTPAAT